VCLITKNVKIESLIYIYNFFFFAKGHFANASKSLDLGLSYNLSISNWPLYNLLNGLVHKHFERNNECIQDLENSLNNLSSNIFV